MSNRIVNVELVQQRATPAVAELWVVVTPERVTPATEVRGKLVGPRCRGVTTVEVAYPFRPVVRTDDAGDLGLTCTAVVPEPNLWTPTTPFVYEAIVELWQDGARCDRRECPTQFQSRGAS